MAKTKKVKKVVLNSSDKAALRRIMKKVRQIKIYKLQHAK